MRKTKSKNLMVRMEPDVFKSLETVATKLDMSVAWCIRRAIERFLEDPPTIKG